MHNSTKYPAQAQARIVPDHVNQLFFQTINPYVGLVARDHYDHFGADVADMVGEVVNEAYAKAVDHLRQLDHQRFYSHDGLVATLTKWATWWCEHFAAKARQKAARAAVCTRNARDRLAHIRTKYSAEAAGLGRERSLQKRQRNARDQARRCATLRRCGWTLARIADALNISVRTVQRHLKNNAQRLKLLVYAVRFIDWTFGKDDSGLTEPREIETGTEKPLPNVAQPQPSRPAQGEGEKNAAEGALLDRVERDPGLIGRILGDWWAKTAPEEPQDEC